MKKNKFILGCIDDCLRCYRASLESIRKCLALGGEHATTEHIRDCILSASACPEAYSELSSPAKEHKAECNRCDDTCYYCQDKCESSNNKYKICSVACFDCNATCKLSLA